MKRHATDLFALLCGLAFVLFGVGIVTHEVTGRTIDPAWLTAAGFILLGTVALVATLLRHPLPSTSTSTSRTLNPMFVCCQGSVVELADPVEAVRLALTLAAAHTPVALDLEEARARSIARRALPGMVLCRRDAELPGCVCYPLTATSALVTSASESSSRSPVARTLRSTTPRATPLAPTTSCSGTPTRSASANFTPGLTSRSS